MRIHLPLHPHHFTPQQAGSGPLARIGGELVVIELQGELEWEGDRSDSVVGVLGLDRPDRPTLHIGEHHLLHGKMANLPKPYAVIRKAQAPTGANADAHALQGDAADEESDEEREAEAEAEEAQGNARKKRKAVHGDENGEEEEDEGPLFPEAQAARDAARFTTPTKRGGGTSRTPMTGSSAFPSSPLSAPADYSSELDPMSSPPGPEAWNQDDEDEQREREREHRRAQRRQERREKRRLEQPRTRYYEVVGVVRKKVVFALRPEPLVTATCLPE